MRTRGEPHAYEPTEATEQQEFAMRFFPLEADGGKTPPPHVKQRTVNPLAHRQNPLSNNPANMIGQRSPLLNNIRTPNPEPRIPNSEIRNPNLPPERAAEQFSRINKGLPDGVQYEPLDEQTLKLLRERNQAVAPPTAKLPAPPMQLPTTPSMLPDNQPNNPSVSFGGISPEIAKTIEGLSQNSRNAQIFYGHMAKIAPDDAAERVFNALSMECKAQIEQYNAVLAKYFNRAFTPNESEINTLLPYDKALSLALTEENKAIGVLSGLLYDFTDAEAERMLQRIINKKITGYHRIQMLENKGTGR